MKKNYKLILLLIFFRALIVNGQISNYGDLKIVSGTNVAFGLEYLNNGNHVSDGNLHLKDNFVNNGSTSSSSGTTFFESTSSDILQISGTTNTINFYNLEVDLTSIGAKGLTVQDQMAVNLENSLHLKNGDLRLVGETQLIQTHSGTDTNIPGSGKLLKDQQGDNSVYSFNYWSSPVNQSGNYTIDNSMFDGTDSNINPFSPQVITFTNGSPFNGEPSVLDGSNTVIVPLEINNNWLYAYAGNGSFADWLSIDENTILNIGQGYTMKGTGTSSSQQNYVFSGKPNNGDYNISINIYENALIGNPYPSALDAELFLTDNSAIIDALYFWVDGGSTSHNLSQYLGGYATKNLTGGVPPSVASPLISGIGSSGTVTSPSRFVAVGQGFFVQAFANGNIQFNNAQRIFKTEDASETNFYRNTENLENVNQFIRIGYEDPEEFHRQLLLGFLPNTSANENYNPGYDASLYGLREDDLFFIIDDNEFSRYGIQGVGDFHEEMEFDLGLIINELGTHTIMLDSVENFAGTVFLRDYNTNTEIDLTQSNYEFSLPAGNYNNRYTIAFKPLNTLNTKTNSIDGVNIFYDGLEAIIIKNTENINIKKVKVYNMLGQQVIAKENDLGTQENIIIPFKQKNGVYIVKLMTQNGTKSTKILTY